MATLKDVAKLAELSPSVVSKYLNNPNSVRESSKRKIETAIKELNYVPNPAARALRKGRINLYLVIIPQIDNPFYIEQFSALNEEAEKRNVHLLIQTTKRLQSNGTEDNVNVDILDLQRVDGIFLLVSEGEELLKAMGNLPVPIPVVAFCWPCACQGLDTVVLDLEECMYTTTRHLIDQGHTRIGYLADHHKSMENSLDKIDGFYRALAERGIPLAPELVRLTPPRMEGGYYGAEELLSLESPPSAIVCESDILAVGCIKYALKCGLAVPDQLAVTGFDNTVMAQYYTPAITSSAASSKMMAISAFNMIEERKKNPQLPPQCIVYHSQLFPRESSVKKKI